MEKKDPKVIEGPSTKFLTETQKSVLPMVVAPLNSRRLRHAIQKQTMENDLNKAKEELKQEEKVPDVCNGEAAAHKLSWFPLFYSLAMIDFKNEKPKASLGAIPKLKLRSKNAPPFTGTKPVELENWMSRYRILKKDKAIQTDPSIESCPMCLREEARRLAVAGRPNERPPSIVDPVPVHSRTKDVAVEAPDRTFYSSDQLTFFRFGNFVYRGWTYRTLDGRIEHVPRVPRGIPIDEIRVEKPLRTPAPR